MTVTRCRTEQLNAEASTVVDALAATLDEGQKAYQYTETEVSESGMSVAAVIKPNSWPLLMSTRLSVHIGRQSDDFTLVTAKTKSQWFIFGDVLNYYNGYLDDLIGSLERRCSESAIAEN